MKTIFSIVETKKKDHLPVQRFIELVDHEFYPPLSERGGGIPERIEKCLDTSEANYLIARLNEVDISDPLDGIIGMIGCTKNWKDESSTYVNFLATHPDYRKYGVSKALTRELEFLMEKQGFERIYVCTWSTNPAAMDFYEKIGYNAYSIILNHRGNGVHTINYKKKI
ncbi:GNAT family N-acetyltransferase [Methanolobus bombayensis]|uniref:GNAT family N-acetyltransferase n=1 Tax=Methanolobus bombayensis TaxID=38023 RepID=UPI001AE73E3A|nr:GNAT family N-acetyltransferase [Methanolobus bombayensis]MBP1910557.1 ribosomal protein S18 acetylase RimI-like enzyme [Methanolobus bombayensis]